MTDTVKRLLLSARVDQLFFDEVSKYVEAQPLNQSKLVRTAVTEYMANHPIKIEAGDKNKVKRPGGL